MALLLIYCPVVIQPVSRMYLNRAFWLRAYLRPERLLYMSEPARIHKSGS